MKLKSLLTVLGCTAALTFAANAQQLVTNGNFNAGISGFAQTVGSSGAFNPAAFPPLDSNVIFMNTSSQVIQTFAGVKLQSNFTYTISFDVIGSVGDFSTPNFMNAYVSYGSSSGSSSAFAGSLEAGNLLSGSNFLSVQVTSTTAGGTGQSGSVSFTTPNTLAGDAFTKDLAIVLEPNLNNTTGFQVYVDNVSVTAVPEPSTWAMLGAGVCAMVFFRRRKVA